MKKYFLFFVCLSFFVLFDNQLFGSQFNKTNNQMGSSLLLTGEDYITGEDGVPRMSVNVWGHVKYPGTYLVYDGIDLLNLISLAEDLALVDTTIDLESRKKILKTPSEEQIKQMNDDISNFCTENNDVESCFAGCRSQRVKTVPLMPRFSARTN